MSGSHIFAEYPAFNHTPFMAKTSRRRHNQFQGWLLDIWVRKNNNDHDKSRYVQLNYIKPEGLKRIKDR